MKNYQKLPVYVSMLTTLISSLAPTTTNAQGLEGYVMADPTEKLYFDSLRLPVDTSQGRKLVYCSLDNTTNEHLYDLADYIIKGDKIRIKNAVDSGPIRIESCDIEVIDDLVN